MEELYSVRDTTLGDADDSDMSLQNAADEFIGSLNWDIAEASKQDLSSWRSVSELLTGTGLWHSASSPTRWTTTKRPVRTSKAAGSSTRPTR